MNLLPKTIEGWCAKKRLFMRLITKEPDPEQAEVYENAIDYCDRKVGQVHKVNCKIFIIILACLILAIGGCISNTLDGMRQDIHNASRPADQAKWTR